MGSLPSLSIMLIFLLLLIAIIPQDFVARDYCETIERNHFYDEEGRLVFIQLIFIDADSECHESVVAWRMAKDESHVVKRDWDRDCFYVTFMDGERVRTVRSGGYRETWLQYDPELSARETLPQEKRRGLKHP